MKDPLKEVQEVWINMYSVTTFKTYMVDYPDKFRKAKFGLFFITSRIMIPHYILANILSFFVLTETEENAFLSSVLWLQITQAWFKIFWFEHCYKDLKEFQLKHETFHSSQYRRKYAEKMLSSKYKILKKLQTYGYLLCYVNVSFWCFDPFMRAKFHVLPSNYLMVTINNLYLKILVAVYEAFFIFFLITHFFTVILYFIFAVNLYVGQMKILNECLVDRSEKESCKLISEDSEEIEKVENKQPMNMKYFVEDHQRLLKLYRKLAEILGPIMLVSFVCVLFEICLLTLLTQQPDEQEGETSLLDYYLKKFKYATFWMTCCTETYLFSWICSKLIETRESTHFALYKSDWYKQDVSTRKIILLSMSTLYPTRKITALGFADIELETFVNVMKASYSFYTVLRETAGMK